MDTSQVLEGMGEVLAEVFGRDISPAAELRAEDVPEWDSLENIRFIVSVEKRFQIRFTAAESSSFQTLGEMAAVVSQKMDAA